MQLVASMKAVPFWNPILDVTFPRVAFPKAGLGE